MSLPTTDMLKLNISLGCNFMFLSVQIQFHLVTKLWSRHKKTLGEGEEKIFIIMFWLKTPGFVTTNMVGHIQTSYQKHYFFFLSKHGEELS